MANELTKGRGHTRTHTIVSGAIPLAQRPLPGLNIFQQNNLNQKDCSIASHIAVGLVLSRAQNKTVQGFDQASKILVIRTYKKFRVRKASAFSA